VRPDRCETWQRRSAVHVGLGVAVALAVAAVACDQGTSAEPAAGLTPERSIVTVSSRGCTLVASVGVGWVGGPGRVVTAAHVVRGATRVQVGGGPARIAAVDLRTDVAVLVPQRPLHRPALPLASRARSGRVLVARFAGRHAESVSTKAGPTRRTHIDEPVDHTTYTRAAFAIDRRVPRGASGGPVIDASGHVIGMVFASTREGRPSSFATAVEEIAAVLRRLPAAAPAVPTGRCG
jgi:S1-C subfamily serine protease